MCGAGTAIINHNFSQIRSMQIQDIIRHIFNYPYPSNSELVSLANSRRGFGNDVYSVAYPVEVDAESMGGTYSAIPRGCVEVCCQAYTGEDVFVAETEYLRILQRHLEGSNSPLAKELTALP